ncbi:scopoletin glucosyltransferase-like [Silene latifolia]|uniref:scopoletin glucosyltransferase-like n=1 Tax=Silene latifolia TaxID=37657 RepID=UPI003D780108
MSSNNDKQLHMIFLPYMAPGHMMPMIEIAGIFASQGGTKATIITTPANASRFQTTINRDNKTGQLITFLTVSLPTKEVGLPEGCENLVSAQTRETTFKLIRAIEMLQPKLETMLVESKPDCIVSDYLYPWTVDVAEGIGIPRLAFSGSCFFNQCICYSLETYRPHDKIVSENEEFVVTDLPDNITITKSQLQDLVKGETSFNALFDRLKEAEKKSFGVLINSFYELERDYADYYRKVIGIKSWHIGPLSLFNRSLDDKLERGDKSTVDAHSCLSWLDSKESNSVLYICFGSLTRFTKAQITEMSSALQNSGCSFIWVLGKVMKCNDDESGSEQEAKEWWLPDGFEETALANGKGFIIKGWAPQVVILEHNAIGGFMTHCGWNSILEGVCAGVPLITWPVFAEQFYNEKLVTQVLKVGVPVGNMVWKAWATDESELVEKEKIEIAISKVMGGEEEAGNVRTKAKMLKELAYKAVEAEGSSNKDIKALLQEIKMHRQG